MKHLLSSAAVCAAILISSPVLAFGDCVTHDNITYERGSEKNPTQTCVSMSDCPTPSMFASLSGQVSNAANDAPDTHHYEVTFWIKGHEVTFYYPSENHKPWKHGDDLEGGCRY